MNFGVLIERSNTIYYGLVLKELSLSRTICFCVVIFSKLKYTKHEQTTSSINKNLENLS